MDALQEMRRGDVGHVEWRVLAEMDHVELGEVLFAGMRQAIMVAGLVLDGEAMAEGDQLAVAEREIVGRVIERVMAALLRLEQQREGRNRP